MCIACGGLPSKENNPCGLCGTDRDRLTYDPTVMQDDLLKRAACAATGYARCHGGCMIKTCEHYGMCRKPVTQCNSKCDRKLKVENALDRVISLNDAMVWGEDQTGPAKVLREEISRMQRLENFINDRYWDNPEDAIGDIRKFITTNKA